jgi:hypothetical protein
VPFVAQPQQRFDAGQDIQPIFEGWQRSDDGSITLHFGYLNRNYREQPSIPIGPNNAFSPGDPDRGQPAYFYPRTQRYAFSVRAPANMSTSFEDGLVWTVTHRGSTQKAIGWLQPEWEIDENTIASGSGTGRGRSKVELFANESPAITVKAARSSVAVGEPLTLTAVIMDDELPTKKPPRGTRRSQIPSLSPPADAPDAPDNIQQYRKPLPPRNGLSVAWVVYRGSADAAFDPSGYQRAVAEAEGTRRGPWVAAVGPLSDESQSIAGDGWTSATFETTVTFDTPGNYRLRAYASDAMDITPADLTVTVTDGGRSTGAIALINRSHGP